MAVGMAVGLVAAGLLALNVINVLVTIFLAIILGEAIRLPVVALERRGVPRGVGIAGIYLSIIATIGTALALILPALTEQLQALFRESPALFDAARRFLPGFEAALIDLGLEGQLHAALGQLAQQATPLLRSVAA